MKDRSSDGAEAKPRRNIFEDPAIVEAGKDDPFVQFVAKNWRILIGCLIALGLGMVGYNRFMATALQKRADATKILSEVQEGYRSLVDKQEVLLKTKEEERAAKDDKARTEAADKAKKESEEIGRLRDRLGLMLVGLESPPPFSTYASLYKGLVAARFGDFDTTSSILSSINWEQAGKPGSPERTAAEIAVLGLSRALLDSDKSTDAVKLVLQQLAEKGEFAAAGAVDTLSLLAITPEDKERVRALIQSVQQRFPAQQKVLSDAAERVAA